MNIVSQSPRQIDSKQEKHQFREINKRRRNGDDINKYLNNFIFIKNNKKYVK
jgi:hypothetical protein